MNRSHIRIAAVFLGVSAVGILGAWAILLFTAIPESISIARHFAELFKYLFGESDLAWWFGLFAIYPFLLLSASVLAWRVSDGVRSLLYVTLAVILLTIVAAFYFSAFAPLIGAAGVILLDQCWKAYRIKSQSSLSD
jgi:hypothetical protein